MGMEQRLCSWVWGRGFIGTVGRYAGTAGKDTKDITPERGMTVRADFRKDRDFDRKERGKSELSGDKDRW